jgi:riboflavin synthase
MFTGLIEEVGSVLRLERRGEGGHLYLRARKVLENTKLGDSIAVSGPCLTVVALTADTFAVDCMPETLERSTIGALRPGDEVNLERALAVGDRLGGHLVMGHVDAVGTLLAVRPRANAVELRVSLPDQIRPFVAAQGSVAVDGISLTVTDVGDDDFGLGIIPHTVAETTLRSVSARRRVNLEVDVLARYVRRALSVLGAASPDQPGRCSRGGLDEDLLRSHGFLD